MVTAGRSVLYEYPKGLPKGTALSFCTGKPEVNISDGCEPSCGLSGPTLLVISSPRRGEGRPFNDEFIKDAFPIYLREPNCDEMMAMGKLCFGLRDDDAGAKAAARDRMRRHGNIPRYVFGHVSVEAWSLEQAIKRQRVQTLRDFVATEDDSAVVRDISFRVVHYVVSADCLSVSYRWASPYVGRHVAALLRAADLNDRLSLLFCARRGCGP